MAKEKKAAGVMMPLLNRDIWEAFDAIQLLTARGWPDARDALAVGRTARRLRDKRAEVEDARQMLLKQYGEVQPDGAVTLKDHPGFSKAWKALMDTTVEVEVFPISLTAAVSRQKACETCKRGPVDDMPAGHLEMLVYIGAIKEDGAA